MVLLELPGCIQLVLQRVHLRSLQCNLTLKVLECAAKNINFKHEKSIYKNYLSDDVSEIDFCWA